VGSFKPIKLQCYKFIHSFIHSFVRLLIL
jgi:hypothetical protein